MLIRKSITDLNISHEEFKATMNERKTMTIKTIRGR